MKTVTILDVSANPFQVQGLVYKKFLIHEPIFRIDKTPEYGVSNAVGCGVHKPFFSQRSAKEFIDRTISALEKEDLEFILTARADTLDPHTAQWRRIGKVMRPIKDEFYQREEP